ncbi:MAG TPA: hypothetical protein VJN18_12930 [Polyangiaceae bacterium]|nr:hypothetical protein [Polyangiaceae bacterium]
MRLSVGLGFGGALGLSLIGSASPGEAADAQHFSWSWVRLPGAETCAAAEEIAGAVRARLGRDPFATQAERHIEGWVERSEDRWLAHLNVTGLDGALIGARQLESAEATCATLVDAVTLAVVLTIDPQASLDAQPPGPPKTAAGAGPDPAPAALAATPPAPTPVLPAQTATAREPSPQPPGVREPALSMTAAVRALAVSGVLPRARAGAEAGAELELSRHVGIAAAVGFLPSVRTDDKRFAFGLIEASLGPCVTLVGETRTRLGLCAEAQLGAIQALTYDVDVDPLPPSNHFWFAVRAGTRLNQRLVGPLGFELGVQALVPVIRHEFTLRGTDERVHQAKHLGLWASAGLTASIP